METDSYKLQCARCGKLHADAEDRFLLHCDEDHGPALLRSEYGQEPLTLQPDHPGLFRYSQWLPIRSVFDTPVRTAVFRSENLAERIGLENLWLAFNGYWPERGGVMETCSFKELEAFPVCARRPEGCDDTLVVSSAGNTGRAFLQTCSRHAVPALIVVPEAALPAMWLTVEKHPEVKLAVLQGDGDYLDAIELAAKIAELDGYFPEGGAKNVARRDGMGTVVLAAVEAIGKVPDHYFQAVGSGTGGIAAWEMSRRLNREGRYGSHRMKLHLVQNEPFALMSDAWAVESRDLPPMTEKEAKDRIHRLHSGVLSNRKPPYGISGGVYDALTDTAGQMYSVTSEEALLAGWLFESLEGCDLDPAAEVALAGLVRAVRQGTIDSSDVVLLNLTGGGRKRLELEETIQAVQPDYLFASKNISHSQLEKQLLHAPIKTPA
ncbi:MAG: cysteate synthase [Spirochaetaceae bacterium]|nr:MAG: cysteate synthase [Spirochaetaceae bacterium]